VPLSFFQLSAKDTPIPKKLTRVKATKIFKMLFFTVFSKFQLNLLRFDDSSVRPVYIHFGKAFGTRDMTLTFKSKARSIPNLELAKLQEELGTEALGTHPEVVGDLEDDRDTRYGTCRGEAYDQEVFSFQVADMLELLGLNPRRPCRLGLRLSLYLVLHSQLTPEEYKKR
jgi:hypothetical protein